jgi:hypothetical protein
MSNYSIALGNTVITTFYRIRETGLLAKRF